MFDPNYPILQDLRALEAEQVPWDPGRGLVSSNPAHRKILAGQFVFRINILLHADFIAGKNIFRIHLV